MYEKGIGHVLKFDFYSLVLRMFTFGNECTNESRIVFDPCHVYLVTSLHYRHKIVDPQSNFVS